MARPLTREQEIVKKLRTAAYTTREARITSVKSGQLPYAHLTDEEILEILPGRRIAWLGELSRQTALPDQPLWFEMETVVSDTGKRMTLDPVTRVLTFQDREWQTRTVKLDRVFEITIRVIPQREARVAPTRSGRRRQLTKRLVVG